tara:strand:- start:1591 stop:2013 length:423 start_codon:yes stop_codon:yes gene_type:complete
VVEMRKTVSITVILLAVWVKAAHAAYAGQYNWITDKDTQAFLREFGFPVLVALGLFILFGWFLHSVTSRFFDGIRAAHEERVEANNKLIEVMDTAVKESNTVMIQTVSAISAMEKAIRESSSACVDDHRSIIAKVDAING